MKQDFFLLSIICSASYRIKKFFLVRSDIINKIINCANRNKNTRVLKMDLSHIKYAVEVEKTKSITKAAENLFMGQPNLSRSIRELEQSLGIKIFKRTSKGVIPTEQGEEFLNRAKSILSEVEKIEGMHSKSLHSGLTFSISAPEAFYITQAFASMISGLPSLKNICFNYIVTDNLNVMDNVSQNGHDLGIIRFNSEQEKYYMKLLKEKSLVAEQILEFEYVVLMSVSHSLSGKENIFYRDLSDYIELSGRDQHANSLQIQEAKTELPVHDGKYGKHLLTSGHVSQLYLLSSVSSAYMWASPVPAGVLKQYKLVQRGCGDVKLRYSDYLIYRKDYKFNDHDNKFISELQKVKNEIPDSGI